MLTINKFLLAFTLLFLLNSCKEKVTIIQVIDPNTKIEKKKVVKAKVESMHDVLSNLSIETKTTEVWIELINETHVRKKTLVNGAMEVSGKQFFVSGTACDMPNEDSHKDVYLFIDDKVFPVNSRQNSQGIANETKKPKLTNCKFNGVVNLASLSKGEHQIKVIVVTNKDTYYRVEKLHDPFQQLPNRKLKIRVL